MQKARGRPRAFAFVRRPASWRPRLFHLFLGLSQPLQWADDWVGLGVGKIVRKDRRRPIAIRGGGRRSEASAIKRVLKQTSNSPGTDEGERGCVGLVMSMLR